MSKSVRCVAEKMQRVRWLNEETGIPKGFGAGFKLKDKEREKGKEKEKEKESSDKIPSSSSGLEKEKDANIEEKHRIRTRHKSFRHSHHHPRDDEDSAIPGAALSYEHSLHHPPTGWTSMLEDWYVNGGLNPGHSVPSGLNSNVTHDGSLGAIGYLEDSDVPLSAKSKSTGDLNARMNARRKGPYQLLVKERMMGLYLAIFIHRDIKDLVRGEHMITTIEQVTQDITQVLQGLLSRQVSSAAG